MLLEDTAELATTAKTKVSGSVFARFAIFAVKVSSLVLTSGMTLAQESGMQSV